MTPATGALWLAIGLALSAVLAAAFVLVREAARRVSTKAALRRIEAARTITAGRADENLADVAAKLRASFDEVTIARVIDELLRDDVRRDWGARLFRELGLVATHVARLREARSWSERTDAAQALGRAGWPDAIPALVAALRDPYEDAASVKVAAAEALAMLKDPGAVPILVRELHDADESASRPIAEALVRFGAMAVPDLLVLLADETRPSGRVWAARILGHSKAVEAVDPLVGVLHSRSDLLRIATAAALGEIRDRRALQPLVQAALRDPAPQVRAHAAAAVARIEPEGSVDVLVSALADPDYVTRLRALEAFENIQLKDPSALVGALRDPKNEVRHRAALALERVGYMARVVDDMASNDPRTSRDAYYQLLELGRAGLTDAVVSYVSHPSFAVRALAARAAGDLGATNAGRQVLVAADDTAWPVRAAAAETIGRLRLPEGIASLVSHLSDPEEPVREAAAEALEAFSGADVAAHVKSIAAAYARGGVPIRMRMVALAARIEFEEATVLVTQASTDPSDAVRLRAVQAIARAEVADRFVPQLVERITDASLEVRTAAVAAIGAAASIDAFEALLRALPGAPLPMRDRIAEALARGGRVHLFSRIDELAAVEDVDVRLGIAWTLGRIGEASVVPYLSSLLRDPSPLVRASTAGALAKVDAPEALTSLLGACEDRDPRTRAAVLNALRKRGTGDRRVIERIRARLVDPDAFVRNRAALAMAVVAGPEAEAALADPEQEHLIDAPARIVALALSGSETALARAFDLMMEPGALTLAAAFLDHEDGSARAAFFERIKLPDPTRVPESLNDPSIVPQYDTVLRSSLDIASRRVAVEALARVASSLAVEVLVDALASDPAEEIRLRTAQALAPRIGDERARAGLVRAVDDPSAEVASVAIRALRDSKDKRAEAALFNRLGGPNAKVSEAVEESLATMHAGDLMTLLDRVMGVDRPEVLVAGIRVLDRLCDPMTIPLLEYLIKSQHAEVRCSTLRALSKLPGQPRTEAAIDGALDDPSESVRRVALASIAAAGDSNAVRRLERARFDPSPPMRAELARLLGATPPGPSLALLRFLVDDVAVEARRSAFATLLARAEPDGLRLFWERWKKGQVDLLGEPRGVEIVGRLSLVLASSGDEDCRKAAVSGIAALRVSGFEKHLIPALRDPSPDVRVEALRALTGNDDADVRARIAELFNDPVADVREAARRSHLRMIG